MGCVFCNLIHISEHEEPFPSESAKQDFMNELAGDIAQNHPELVFKINECLGRAGVPFKRFTPCALCGAQVELRLTSESHWEGHCPACKALVIAEPKLPLNHG